MPELERVQLANKLGIITCEGRELSLGNTMLIALQHPTASIVGGFKQWMKTGRVVMKGQHGMMIWVPTGSRNAPEPMAMIVYGSEPPAEDHRFIIGTVFDISQTEELKPKASEAIIEVNTELVLA